MRAVFFDAVGTLIVPDPPVQRAYAEAARRFGAAGLDEAVVRVRFRAAFAHQEAIDRSRGWRTDEAREEERWRAIVAETVPEASDPESCFRALHAHFARPGTWCATPGAGEVLGRLAERGLLLGLASNFDARLEGVRAGLPALAWVSKVVVSSLVGWRKPAAGFFEAVVAEAGCRPGEILFVGDDFENDYLGATAAGLRAVLLDPLGEHPRVPGRIARLEELAVG